MEQPSAETAKLEKLFYDRGLKLLARREHSRSELTRKLLGKPDLPENSSNLVEAALDRLTENGYLSDDRFADLFVRQRYQKGSGYRDILARLRKRGIDSRLANSALAEFVAEEDIDWYQHAADVLAAKFRLSSDLEENRDRMIRFLQQRGFADDEVLHALDRATVSQ